MRDHARTIQLLETKAADGACPAPEREALLAKAAELRVAHGAPPKKPPADRGVMASPTPEPWGMGFTSGTTTSSTTGSASWVSFTVGNG